MVGSKGSFFFLLFFFLLYRGQLYIKPRDWADFFFYEQVMSPFSLLFMVLMARRLPVLMGAAAVAATGVFFFLSPPIYKTGATRTHTPTDTRRPLTLKLLCPHRKNDTLAKSFKATPCEMSVNSIIISPPLITSAWNCSRRYVSAGRET